MSIILILLLDFYPYYLMSTTFTASGITNGDYKSYNAELFQYMHDLSIYQTSITFDSPSMNHGRRIVIRIAHTHVMPATIGFELSSSL